MRGLLTKNLINQKLKGGALFIAVLISVIIGILLLMFILLAKYNQLSVTKLNQATQLQFNLQSAFQIAQSDYFTEEQNNKWFKNAVNDDSIKINEHYWGAYILINVITKNRHDKLSQTGLYGSWLSADSGIVVSDNSRPIGVSGNVIFKANCYLPSAGIKPAFIEGQSYQSNAQNAGYVKKSPNAIAEPNTKVVELIEKQKEISYSDSLVSELGNKINHSFSKKTIVLQTGNFKFSGISLQNNIKIICSGEVEIDSSCRLNNILIICKKIKFKTGFKGNVHIIASDSIITEKKCLFEFPSSFSLIADIDKSSQLRSIVFDEDCKFYGGVIALNQNSNLTAGKVFVKLNSKSEVNGFVYSSNYCHAEGQINATLITNSLLLKTPSAVYENHLLGCEINPKKHASVIAVPQIFKNKFNLICCKKINI